ncbi:MAG: MFS transporter [Chloroflexi bacterium]|nr:MFS transporter [Chloroflexota bacterium]
MLNTMLRPPAIVWRYIVHSPQGRRTLWFGSVMHIWSDLHFALMFPLLPLIESDMALSFTQVGILRATYSGASAVLQIPAGFIAESMGEFWLLLAGNVWVSVGLVGMALAPAFVLLVVLSFVGGIGGGFQHPLASSMVSRAYDDRGRSTAVGTVNFAGDLGKMLAPPIVAGAIAVNMGWRQLLWIIGLVSLVFMAFSALTRRAVDIGRPVRETNEAESIGARKARLNGFVTLSGIGALDSMARVGALTFLPFVLISKDVSQSQAISMLLFVFIGGAAGKFVVGWLGDRFSTVSLIWATKGLTAVLIVAALYTPMSLMVPLLVLLGVGLNGTSSILYATVAEYVPAYRRARFYGFFYTTNEIGTVAAPICYGIIADAYSLSATMLVMGGATALILPASLLLLTHRFSR